MKEQLMKCLEILGFPKSETIPKLKQIKSNYLRLLIQKQPDKNGGVDKGFNELQKAYEIVSNYVFENLIVDGEDHEEVAARKEFKDINIVRLNTYSATIKPPTAHEPAWEEILQKHYGNPIDSSHTDNGKKYSAPDGVFVTAYNKKKEPLSTLLIQGQSGYLNFVQQTLPQLYQEVQKILPSQILTDTPEESDRKRKRVHKPSMLIECDDCPKIITSAAELKS